jgi:hypothetical protein
MTTTSAWLPAVSAAAADVGLNSSRVYTRCCSAPANSHRDDRCVNRTAASITGAHHIIGHMAFTLNLKQLLHKPTRNSHALYLSPVPEVSLYSCARYAIMNESHVSHSHTQPSFIVHHGCQHTIPCSSREDNCVSSRMTLQAPGTQAGMQHLARCTNHKHRCICRAIALAASACFNQTQTQSSWWPGCCCCCGRGCAPAARRPPAAAAAPHAPWGVPPTWRGRRRSPPR